MLYINLQDLVLRGVYPTMNQICFSQDDSAIWSQTDPFRRDEDIIDPITPEFQSPARGFRCLIQSQKLSIYANDQHNRKDVLRQTNTMGNAERRKIIKPERDFESLDDLITFLVTEPPPENYMSIGDSLEQSRPQRKSPLKLFQRQNSKKIKQPRQILLPDSAVAAKTTQGHWHIAITIPPEHDPLLPKPDYKLKEEQLQGKESATTNYNDPITILKPAIMDTRPRVAQVGCALTTEISRSTSELMFDSAVLEAEPLQISNDNRSIPEIPKSAKGAEPFTPQSSRQKSDTRAMSPVVISQNRRKGDPTHSCGIAPGGKSIHTTVGHSEETTSITTAQDGPFFRKSTPQIKSATGRSQLDLSINTKMVELASGYSTSNVTGSRYTFANGCSLPPNRKLPDLPESSENRRSIKSGSIREPLSTTKESVFQQGARSEGHSASNVRDSQRQYIQSRQKHVRALRSRDMAATRASVSGQTSETHLTTDDGNKRESSSISKGPETRREHGKNKSSLRRANSLTPIMVVVDSEPALDFKPSIGYDFPSPPRNTPKLQGWTENMSSDGMRRAPFYPVTVSISGDKGPCSSNQKPIATITQQAIPPSTHIDIMPRLQSSPASSLEAIEERLKNIEHSNALLLQAFNTVVRMGANCLEPKNLISHPGTEHAVNLEASRGRDAQSAGDLESIEPLMKELQEAARVSLEQKGVEKDFDADKDMH